MTETSSNGRPEPRSGAGWRRRLLWLALGLMLLVLSGTLGILYTSQPTVLGCVVHDFVTRDRDGKALSSEKTVLVKIRADEGAEFDKQDFSLITSDGNRIKADHVLVVGPGKVGIMDPGDDFSDQSRALVSFKVSDDVSKDTKMRLKYKHYPSVAVPESRKHSQGTFQFAR